MSQAGHIGSGVDLVDAGTAPEALTAVPVRHWGQRVSAVLLISLLGLFVWSVAQNENIQWDVVRRYLFDNGILRGLVVTVELTVLAMVAGIALGVVVAVMRLSKNPVLRWVSFGYVWLFRGTPVLVQLIIWFNLALIFPHIGPGFLQADTNQLITPFVAALLGLGLNEGAYMSEIVRAGILSVDPGQTEAAHALGMTRRLTMRRIVLPQAMRIIIPPTGNETITMLKTTSLVAVIAANDLLTRAQAIYSSNYAVFELLLVASFWYLVLTSVSSVAQYFLERRFARGFSRHGRPGPGLMQRLATNLRPGRVGGGAG
jgi:polar amino acid transport system permease protein